MDQPQTAAALAIVFGLTERLQAQENALDEAVKSNRSQLNTGFVGTPILCPALSGTGLPESDPGAAPGQAAKELNAGHYDF